MEIQCIHCKHAKQYARADAKCDRHRLRGAPAGPQSPDPPLNIGTPDPWDGAGGGWGAAEQEEPDDEDYEDADDSEEQENCDCIVGRLVGCPVEHRIGSCWCLCGECECCCKCCEKLPGDRCNKKDK
jgi:hypothetical protein